MNCEQANQIPLHKVLDAMGYKPLKKHSGGSEQWFENPLRNEKTPSFTVNHSKNLWKDFGTGDGGTVIDLVAKYDNTDISGALQWLENNIGSMNLPEFITGNPSIKFEEKKPRYELTKSQQILSPSLKDYLKERSIPLSIANDRLKEVRYKDTETGKNFYGLGMVNASNGFNVRNKYMKTVIGKADFTAIFAKNHSNRVNVFEGFFDYLTYTTMNPRSEQDEHAIILNSTSLAKKASGFIGRSWQLQKCKVVLWLDNEESGSKAADAVERATGYFNALPNDLYSASGNYADHEDLNAYWVDTKTPFSEIWLESLKYDDGTRLEL